MKLKAFYFSIFWVFLITLDSVSAQEFCSSRFFKPNSTYDLNRRLIFSSLASNVTTHDGFYNSSIGQDSNRIFINGMCIPGTKPETCSACIKGASDGLLRSCPNQTEAYTWPDCCMVRYSNTGDNNSHETFYDRFAMDRAHVLSSTGDINSNVTVFDRIGEDLMSRTITGTPLRTDGHKYYAAGVTSLTTGQIVYAMMQCTPDVVPGDCGLCLRANLVIYESCCQEKQGGAVIRAICFIRWDLHPFAGAFENITLPPPQPQSQPPLSSTPAVHDQENTTGKDGNTMSIGTIVAIVVPTVVILVLVVGFLVSRRRKLYQTVKGQVGDDITTMHSVQFDFKTIEAATDKFSDSNMIGRGGFGEVYRGKLSSGTEVAVKRLSKTSGQGAEEFKSEAVLGTKLQHRNLVRLLGFCLEGEEKILVYEFVANKSLDYFLFDPSKQRELDWTRRYNIIKGIARGIQYLHHDSRLTIIHRDLKASNILLDADMNPKIADFGMARIYRVDQTHVNTQRVVGTYGYMSPEYAMRGHFSMKSDVYSFGVMILETISGKTNSSFNDSDDSPGNLVTHAWKLWRTGSQLELRDPTIREIPPCNEAINRCIHIALLCVQEDPSDRPLLPAIVVMLTSSTETLPAPRAPGFFLSNMSEQSTSMSLHCSINDVSITYLDPR